jgi:hypothetical protein
VYNKNLPLCEHRFMCCNETQLSKLYLILHSFFSSSSLSFSSILLLLLIRALLLFAYLHTLHFVLVLCLSTTTKTQSRPRVALTAGSARTLSLWKLGGRRQIWHLSQYAQPCLYTGLRFHINKLKMLEKDKKRKQENRRSATKGQLLTDVLDVTCPSVAEVLLQ